MSLSVIFIITTTIISLLICFFFSKENKYNIRIKEHDKPLFYFTSFIPLINVAVIISTLVVFIPSYLNYRLDNESRLKQMNQFIKCDYCKVVYRNGYKKDNTCPICNEVTTHIKIKDESFKSDKIPEHVKFKKRDFKDEKIKNKKNKLKENESLYEEVKQKNLEKKKTML